METAQKSFKMDYQNKGKNKTHTQFNTSTNKGKRRKAPYIL